MMREQQLALKRARYRENYPIERQAILARRREHYALNREAKIAAVKAWRAANPERCLAHYRKAQGARRLFLTARARAKKFEIPFDIVVDDIVIPKFCPALWIELRYNDKHHGDDSPSLDRIVPALGYVRGNIAVISIRANRIKTDAKIEEIEKVIAWLRGCTEMNAEADRKR